MKISLNWLKEFVSINIEPEKIDEILTSLGIEVEKIMRVGEKFDKFVIGKVIKCEVVAGSDHLHYCEVRVGEDVYSVVCGAPNVGEGQMIVLGMVGALVPQNGMVLERRKIRGVVSNGMICSRFELGLDDDHSGIWVLPDDATEGLSLADYLGLNDVIFEISVTPNRGDCLSHLGIAREIAAYYDLPVHKPVVNLKENEENNKDINQFVKVEIKDPEKNPRYVARLVRNVQIGPSPDWIKKRLEDVGLRSINNVVDATNIVLMELNQPLHAFDFDKIHDNKIVVRTAKDGEKFITLDGKERTLDSNMLMICDTDKPIAIAGVMGGENSEITNSTRNVLIESAYFNPSSIRRTSKKLGIQSDASYRFERGVDIDNLIYSADRAAQLIADLSGGEIVGGYVDAYPLKMEKPMINLNLNKTEKIIGIHIPKDKILDILRRLNFAIMDESPNSEFITVRPPSYRNDIELEIDVIEEIARVFGYDNIIPQFVSTIDFSNGDIPKELQVPELRKVIRNFFIGRGFNEILTQNMIDPKSAAFFPGKLVEIANPLGEELSIMRPSMVPSMLKTVANNIRFGNNDLRLFEVAKTFSADSGNSKFIPNISELEHISIALYGNFAPKQWGIPSRNFDFYDVKGIVSELFEFLKFWDYEFRLSKNESNIFTQNYMEIYLRNEKVGEIGESSPKILKLYDIEQSVFIADIYAYKLYEYGITQPHFEAISQYPPVIRDLAFVMDESIPAGDVLAEIRLHSGNLLQKINLFDVYKGKSIGDGKKSLAFNLVFASAERTLTDDEINNICDRIIMQIEKKFNAQLRKF